jgi:ABC-type Fe3+-hydroxamate transport system substrate-binding protein
MAGGENVVSDLKLRYAKIAAETITERRPEVILDAVHIASGPGQSEATARANARADWKVLGEVPAVQKGAVHVLSGREFVTPGPRLGSALRRLAELIHPEAFVPPPPAPPPTGKPR